MKFAHSLNISTSGALKTDLETYFSNKTDQDVTKQINLSENLDPPFSIYTVSNIADILNSEWIDMVRKSLPQEVDLLDYAIVFVRRRPVPTNAHLDVMTVNPTSLCVFALNFVIQDGEQSDMVWYKKKDGSKINLEKITLYGTTPKHELDEAGRAVIDRQNLTLVNTCDLHDIEYRGDSPRWCISLRTNMPYQTWEEAVEAFKPLFS